MQTKSRFKSWIEQTQVQKSSCLIGLFLDSKLSTKRRY